MNSILPDSIISKDVINNKTFRIINNERLSYVLNITDLICSCENCKDFSYQVILETLKNLLALFGFKNLNIEVKEKKASNLKLEIAYELPDEYSLFIVNVYDDFIESEGMIDYIEEKIKFNRLADCVNIKLDKLVISTNFIIFIRQKSCYITVFNDKTRKSIKESLEKVCDNKLLKYEVLNKNSFINSVNTVINKQDYNDEVDGLKADRSLMTKNQNINKFNNNNNFKETSWRKISNASTNENDKSKDLKKSNEIKNKTNFNRSRYYSEYINDHPSNQGIKNPLLPKNNINNTFTNKTDNNSLKVHDSRGKIIVNFIKT